MVFDSVPDGSCRSCLGRSYFDRQDKRAEEKTGCSYLCCPFCVGLLCTLKFFHLGLLAPMGISFYTLTLLGYLFDVYYEIGPVQRNYGKLLLFCCYFPTMIPARS